MSYETTQSSLTGGTASVGSDDLVLSAHVGTNAELFPEVLSLHVDEGAKVADITYGKGVFWNNVPDGVYDVHGTDIDPEKSPTGESVDCRELPYEDDTFDCVVFDPPYAEGFFRRNADGLAGTGSHSSFREAYSDGSASSGSKYHQAVLDIYKDGGAEAKRVLKPDGTFIVKTQDEVSANTQELTHIQITNYYEQELGMYTKDLFILVRQNRPSVSGMDEQVHARKNHSYFLVFEVGA